MKKGEIYEGLVARIDFPNKGIINIEGDSVVVKNAIPGQKVRFQINKKRHGKCEGRLLEVVEKSNIEEATPNCPHYPKCGGCLYQCLSYEEQLKIKENQIKDLLDPVCGDYVFEGIKASPRANGYRNKMEFSFGDEVKDGPLSLGLHKRNSFYDIVTVSDCKIIDDDYRNILKSTYEYFEKQNLPYYKKMQHTGYLRHLVVRKAANTGEILINIVTTSQIDFDMNEYVELICGINFDGKLVGLIHTINDSFSDTVQADEMRVLYGKDYFEEMLLGLKFKITPFSFFQTNSLGAEVLYETAREYILSEEIEGDKIVYDLYSGTGTIAQMLSPAASKVIGVEIVEEAVEAAKENAKLNGITNCEFHAGDVLKVIDDIEDKPDFIVLDPPRDGVHPKALEKIIDNYNCNRILYISCKPTSLVRDLEIFNAKGYQVKKACCVDMFPFTPNVETVVLLSQRKADDYVEVELVLDELDVTSAESKATYKEIQEYVLKEHGLKVSNLYISQVKRKCGIEVGENYNLPKSEDSRQPQCPVEKEKAIRDALEHYGMV